MSTSQKISGTSCGPLGIIGPSGCGKSSLVARLVDLPYVRLEPTWTDRPKRQGEDELEHRFVDAVRFERMMITGRFREVVQPFGLSFRYGLPAFEAQEYLSVAMLRAPFVALFKHYYPTAVIYQIEAPFERAQHAVLTRGGDHGTRLSDFEAERDAGRECADRVFVNITTIDEVWNLVQAGLMQDGLLRSQDAARQ